MMFKYWLTILVLSFLKISAQPLQEVNHAKDRYVKYLEQHGRFTTTGQDTLHYLQWGNPTDPTLLWLHGSYSNAFEIEPFKNSITSLGYHIIAIEYYGHGQTSIPTKIPSVQDFLEDINLLLDSLNIKKCIVGGFSRGAYFATMFDNKYPQKVKALILEDGGISPFLEHFIKMSNQELKNWIEQDIQNRPKALFNEFLTEEEAYDAIKPFGETDTNQLFKNFSFIRKENSRFLIYKGIDTLFGMNNAKNLSKLVKGKLSSNLFANELMSFPFFNHIKKNKKPILLLEAVGDNDQFLQSKYYNRLKKVNNNIIHKVFKRSQHNIHFEEPEEFLQSLILFLKSNKL